MPSSENLPRTLDAWLRRLDAVRLPMQREDQARLQRALGDERLALREVAARVQTCASFTLALVREANQGRNEPATSVEMVLRRLGLKRAAALLRDFELRAESDIPRSLRQAQLVSLHAAQQAEGLFGSRLARLAGEIQLSSLLCLAPLWPLAQAHPALFEQWARRVLLEGEPPQRVEHELFGISLRSLCLALAEHWRLPEWIELGYRLLGRDRRRLVQALHIARDNLNPLHQQQMLDQAPALRRWLTQPANTILLANGLAVAAQSSWDDHHNLRWQTLTGLYLNLPLDEVQQQIHQNAVLSARQHAPQLWHPAQALVVSGSRRATVALQAHPGDAKAWHRQCERLRQPGAFSNALQLLDCARGALAACGLDQLVLLVTNREQTHLLVQQAHGLDPASRRTQIACQDSEILRRMLQQPARLLLDAGNFERLAPLLPVQLTALFPQPPLLLQSLAVQGKVRLLLVAEWSAPAGDPDLQQRVARTLSWIERAMTRMIAPGTA